MSDADTTTTWTLTALVEAATAQIAALPPIGDGRVSDGLDARSVRYYQTIGLLDRPLRYDGRTAIYGVRHLHQLICVRALQAQGLSLSQVQRALSGATDAQLAAAVADALGQAAPAPAPRPEPRALRAVALAPGVIVTIDPSQCADPDAVITALYRTLHPQESTP